VNWRAQKGDIRKAIGARVARAREHEGTGKLRQPRWTQAILAEKLNALAGGRTFSQGFVSAFERGGKPVSLEYMVLFSHALNWPMLDLVEPVLMREGTGMLDVLVPYLERAPRLSQAELEQRISQARGAAGRDILERARMKATYLAMIDPGLADLVRALESLGPDDWSYLTVLAKGLAGKRQQRMRELTRQLGPRIQGQWSNSRLSSDNQVHIVVVVEGADPDELLTLCGRPAKDRLRKKQGADRPEVDCVNCIRKRAELQAAWQAPRALSAYKAAQDAATKRGQPFRPVKQRTTKTSKGGSKKR
jgi:hypothetical protein